MSITANWPWALCLIVRFALVFLVIFSLSQAIASGYDLAQIGKRRFRDHLQAKQRDNDSSNKKSSISPHSPNKFISDEQSIENDADPTTESANVTPVEPVANPTKQKKSRSKKRRMKSDSSKCVTQIDQSIKTTSKPAAYNDTPTSSDHKSVKQSPSKSNKSSKSSLLAALAALEHVDCLIDDDIDNRADADSDDWCTVAKTSKVKSKPSNIRAGNPPGDQPSRNHKRSSRVTVSKVTRDSDGVKSASLFVLTTRTKQTVGSSDDQSTNTSSNPPPYSASSNETSAVVRSLSPIDSELTSCGTSDVWSDVLSEVSMNEETTDMISQSTEGEQVEGYSELTGRMEGQPVQTLHPFNQPLSRSFSPLLDRHITPTNKYNQSLNVRSFNYSQYHATPISVTETKMQETQSLQSKSIDRPTQVLPITRPHAPSPRKGPPGFPAKPPAVHPLLASLKYGSQSLFSRAQSDIPIQPTTPTSRHSQQTGLSSQHINHASPRAAPIVEPSRLSMSADDYSDYENLIDQVLASPSDEDDDSYLSSMSGVPSQSALSMHSWSMSSQRLDANLAQPFSFFDSPFLHRPVQTAIIDDSSSISGWPQRRVEHAQVQLPLAKAPDSPKRSWRAPERATSTRW